MRVPALSLMVAAAFALAACGSDDSGNADSGDRAGNDGARETTTAPKVTDVKTQPIAGGETQLRISEEMQTAFEEADITVEALEPTRQEGDAYVLPITGGRVNLAGLQGTLDHSGGLALRSAGGESLELRDPFVDLLAGWGYPLVTGSRVQFFSFDAQSLDVERTDDGLAIGTAAAHLTHDGADVLNQSVGGSFEQGQSFGELTFRVSTDVGDPAGAAEDALTELEELEQRTQRLLDEAGEDLSDEERRQLEEAGEALEDVLGR